MLAVASAPAVPLPLVEAPVAVGLGTFNHDGHTDAVILASSGQMTIATGAADDHWQTISSIDTGIGPQRSLVASRLGPDPFTDLVTVSDDAVTVLHSDANAGFSVVQTLAAPSVGGFANPLSGTGSLALNIVAGDPLQDLVAVASADNAVLVYRGLVGGTFESTPTTYSTGVSAPTSAAVGDIIGDPLPDLVVGHADGTLVMFEGTAAGLVRRDDLAINESAGVVDLQTADLDGDGNSDLVVTTTNNAFVLFGTTDTMPTSPIVNGDFSAGLTGWETEIVGHTATAKPGRVSSLGGAAQRSPSSFADPSEAPESRDAWWKSSSSHEELAGQVVDHPQRYDHQRSSPSLVSVGFQTGARSDSRAKTSPPNETPDKLRANAQRVEKSRAEMIKSFLDHGASPTWRDSSVKPENLRPESRSANCSPNCVPAPGTCRRSICPLPDGGNPV